VVDFEERRCAGKDEGADRDDEQRAGDDPDLGREHVAALHASYCPWLLVRTSARNAAARGIYGMILSGGLASLDYRLPASDPFGAARLRAGRVVGND